MKPSTYSPASPDQTAVNERLKQLLERCSQGNESAFEELYTLCSARLFAVALRILKVEAIAEEALQEAFIKIWQKSAKYTPNAGSPMTWMYSVARHQALDLLRRQSIREGNEIDKKYDHVALIADETKSLAAMSEDAGLLFKCLDQLTGSTQDCLVSAYCEGYSHGELSKRHDVPTNTVKSWIRRGLISLRACIDENT